MNPEFKYLMLLYLSCGLFILGSGQLSTNSKEIQTATMYQYIDYAFCDAVYDTSGSVSRFDTIAVFRPGLYIRNGRDTIRDTLLLKYYRYKHLTCISRYADVTPAINVIVGIFLPDVIDTSFLYTTLYLPINFERHINLTTDGKIILHNWDGHSSAKPMVIEFTPLAMRKLCPDSFYVRPPHLEAGSHTSVRPFLSRNDCPCDTSLNDTIKYPDKFSSDDHKLRIFQRQEHCILNHYADSVVSWHDARYGGINAEQFEVLYCPQVHRYIFYEGQGFAYRCHRSIYFENREKIVRIKPFEPLDFAVEDTAPVSVYDLEPYSEAWASVRFYRKWGHDYRPNETYERFKEYDRIQITRMADDVYLILERNYRDDRMTIIFFGSKAKQLDSLRLEGPNLGIPSFDLSVYYNHHYLKTEARAVMLEMGELREMPRLSLDEAKKRIILDYETYSEGEDGEFRYLTVGPHECCTLDPLIARYKVQLAPPPSTKRQIVLKY